MRLLSTTVDSHIRPEFHRNMGSHSCPSHKTTDQFLFENDKKKTNNQEKTKTKLLWIVLFASNHLTTQHKTADVHLFADINLLYVKYFILGILKNTVEIKGATYICILCTYFIIA